MGEEKKIDLSQFRDKFAREAKARLGRLNGGLVYLGKNPGDERLEADILREAHTLKGAARMLGFAKISELSLRFEEALARRRDKTIVDNQDLTDALFLALDTLSRLVDALSQPLRDSIDIEPVLDRLKLAQVTVEASVAPEAPAPAIAAPSSPVPTTGARSAGSHPTGYADRGTGTRVDPARLELMSNLLTNAIAHHQRELELRERLSDLGFFYRRTAAALLAAVQDGLAQGEFSPAFARRVTPFVEEGKQAFREVGTQRSELKRRESVVAAALSQNLEELRSEVMAIRTVPILPLLDSFHPMAGALAKELGKEVEVLVRGGKTEIDRKVAEALAEPLIHILRNAVDHGIEAPAERERAGKPRKGRIVITATPKKGRVVLEVEDDGRGIDPNEVREAAVRKGMVSEKAAWRLDDRELVAFVFRSGFSTSNTVTGVSGLGIGMDVVRATAERFNGTSEVHSDPGKGTRVVMELPFSMAVSRVLLFVSGDQYFALPIMHTEGVHKFADRDIIAVEGRKSLHLGETPVPLVWLNRLLGLPDSPQTGDPYLAVMVRQSGKRIALVIDGVEGESEVVVRDLGKYLGKIPLFMGSTILGTGEVALMLDVNDLMTTLRLHAETSPEGVGEGGRHAVDADILVVDDSLLVREMQQRILFSSGYRVETASGAKAALERLSHKRFNVVVAGVRMAGFDGIQLLAEARKTDYTRDLPFILVGSKEHREDLVRARAAGAKGCVTREEFTPDRMTAMIGSILARGEAG